MARRWAKTTLMSRVRCPRATSRAAYERALRADNRFSRELARVYGKENAGDARYLPDAKLTGNKLRAAKNAKLNADACLRKAWDDAKRKRKR